MRFKLAVATILVAACASSPSDSDGTISINGTYATAVTLGQNSCTGVIVQNNPTIVTTTSATSFTLTHAGQTYAGTLAANNSFLTTPKMITAGGSTFTITIAGQFRSNGFDAAAHVVQSASGTTCEYTVNWVGTK